MTKYIFVTGGVVSGLGKGITAASLGRLLKARGLRIAAQKNDDFYRAHCTDVLWNDAPASEIFERQAGEFFGRLLQELQKGE